MLGPKVGVQSEDEPVRETDEFRPRNFSRRPGDEPGSGRTRGLENQKALSAIKSLAVRHKGVLIVILVAIAAAVWGVRSDKAHELARRVIDTTGTFRAPCDRIFTSV